MLQSGTVFAVPLFKICIEKGISSGFTWKNRIDNALNATCWFIEEQHRCMIKSMNAVSKANNISVILAGIV